MMKMSNEPYFCEKCNRKHTRGKIYEDHQEYRKNQENDPSPNIVICPECMGEGVGKRSEEKCGACNGTGAVEIRKEKEVPVYDLRGTKHDTPDRKEAYLPGEAIPTYPEDLKVGTATIREPDKNGNIIADISIKKESCNCQDPAHVKIADPGAPIPEASEIRKWDEEIRKWDDVRDDDPDPLDHVKDDFEAAKKVFLKNEPDPGEIDLSKNIPDSVENGDEKKRLWDRLRSWWKK
jgi:hypothetical protein